MSLQATNAPSPLKNSDANVSVTINQLCDQIILTAQGLKHTSYTNASLPLRLKKEGVEQRKIYCQMLFDITAKIANAINGGA